MDDKELIERLQKLATRVSVLGIDGTNFTHAAARLTALAEENARLRGALDQVGNNLSRILELDLSTEHTARICAAMGLVTIDTALAPAARKEET